MADDAAGAVRRTPRPDEALDTFRCHEPFRRDAEVRVSFTGRYYAGAFMGSHIVDADDHHRCTVPPDAVTLLPDGDVVERAAHPLAANALRRYEAEQGFADHLTVDDFMADAREDVRALAADGLLNDPERGRPVVLLRAEDCSCPTGGDCPPVTPAERDALQARLDAFERWLRPEVVVGWIQPRGYRERYLAEDVIRGLLAGDPITSDQQYTRTASSGPTAQGIPGDSESTVEDQGAALQGDQPTEPKQPCKYVVSAWAVLPGSECIAFAEPGSDYCKPHGDALQRLALQDIAEPTGEVDRG